jgi:Glyoxalase-like domain
MAVRVKSITFDCVDPYKLSLFWSEVSGYAENPEDRNHPDDPEAVILAPDGSAALLFIPVPEPKTVKNRVHLDVVPLGRTRDEEVLRCLSLGATLVADHRKPDGTGWAVLADPEGNEFCVERSDAERQAVRHV